MRRTALAAALMLTACGAEPAPAPDGGAPVELTVLAAASLRTAFEELGARYERAHPGTEVAFSFAGSADLVAQLAEGAPADVLATADTASMDRAVAQGLLDGPPQPFATNVLQIVTPPDDPGRVSSFADLARPGLAVVVCAEQVPCGRALAQVEETSGTALSPVSEETSVSGVLAKVTAGEADAGVVYVTDARAAGDAVRTVPFPEAAGVVNTYPIGTVAGSEHPRGAAELVAHLRGAEAREVLAAAGFGAP